MFFTQIAPLLAKGVIFKLSVAMDGDQVTVDVLPVASNQPLAAQRFTATPQELDNGFAQLMAGYANINITLAEQLEASRAVAKAIADEAAAAAAVKSTKTSKASPPKVEKPRNAAPGGLLSDDADEVGDDADEVGGDPVMGDIAPMSGQPAPAASEPPQTGFSFGL